MFLYDLGMRLYGLGVRLAGAFGNRKAKLLGEGQKSSLSFLRDAITPGESYVWIHAASLGEFEQGRPLMERIRRGHPEKRILLTFYSPSGYEVRKNYAGADIVCYLPPDTPRQVKAFLDIVNPEMAIFVKYEFWLNYLRNLKERHIPTYLISGIFRPGQLFFRPYGGAYRNALRAFTHLYVQDDGSRNLLDNIGINNVTVAGDTRFDRVTDIMRGVKAHPILDRFCLRTPDRESDTRNHRTKHRDPIIFIAGSSWPEDEAVYAEWLRSAPQVKGIIAPHEFDEARLEKLLSFFREEAVLLSDVEKNPELLEGKKILIIDCFGLLASAYSYADIAYVGGGFGAGLHNINEAAVYGVPVFYGPNHSKFIEAIEMRSQGGGIPINSKEEFEAEAGRLVADDERRIGLGKRSAAYIRSKLGATDAIYSDLFV